MEHRTDRFTALEEKYAGYEVHDPQGQKIGQVDDLFVDENDRPEYLGVKMGFLGLRSTLIPWEIVKVDEGAHSVEVLVDKDKAKDGPTFDDDREITPEYEEHVRSYYGVQGGAQASEERGAYGEYYGDEPGHVGPGIREGDTETGEFRGHSEDDEGVNQSGTSDLEDEDELRVQRSEEEVSVPVTEEEVVVEKRPEVKEEIRIRKDSVQEEELVEEDVRREEVDVEDHTNRRRDR